MRITYFQSLLDPTAPTHEVEWNALVENLSAPPVFASKYEAPLIKLAVFGNIKSQKGHFRNDANVTSISGIELDYDGLVVPLPEAAQRLTRAGVESFLYTSAQHRPDAPRWRVLIPLAAEHPPEYRKSLSEAANAILGGICANESHTLSQAYFIGRIEGVPYETAHVQGQPLDHIIKPEAEPLVFTDAPEVPEFRKVDLNTLRIDAETAKLIREGAPKKERSEALMRVANALARERNSPADILCVLADADNGISAKALEGRTVAQAMDWLARFTVAKALKQFPPLDTIFPSLAGKPIDRTKLLHDCSTLSENPRPVKWLIRGILEQETFAVIYGPPGSGKSIIALDMALSIASNTDFHGRAVTPGPVIYVSGEGFGGYPRRLRAWARHNKKPLPTDQIWITSRSVRFREPQSLGELTAAIEAMPVKPSLIVIDTYMRANAGGNENNPQDAAMFVAICDTFKEIYKATVLLVAHTGRGDATRLMGSQVITGAADAELSVTRGDGPHSVLKCTKMKDAEMPPDMHFKLTTVPLGWPDPETFEQLVSWVFEEVEATTALKPSDTQLLFAQCLGSKPIDRDKVRAAFMQQHPAGKIDTKRKAWTRALDHALAREWCKEDGDNLIPSPPAMFRDGIDIKQQVAAE